jgi:hypothetical protein
MSHALNLGLVAMEKASQLCGVGIREAFINGAYVGNSGVLQQLPEEFGRRHSIESGVS